MWRPSPRCTACCARRASWTTGDQSVQYKNCSRPRALAATGPDQVFCWDITYLPTQVRGQHYYLYLFEDLFSRKIVGWQAFDCDSAELASQLMRDICTRQGIAPGQLTVHLDGGASSHRSTRHAGSYASDNRSRQRLPGGFTLVYTIGQMSYKLWLWLLQVTALRALYHMQGV